MSLELGAPFWPPEQTTRHIKLICSPNVAHLLPKLPHFFCTVNVIFRGQLGLVEVPVCGACNLVENRA